MIKPPAIKSANKLITDNQTDYDALVQLSINESESKYPYYFWIHLISLYKQFKK
jgi:hypothetical protein